MSLTLHIALKDVYRLRWVLLLWIVAIASELALASIQATVDFEGHVPFFMAAWTFGNVFIPVIGYGLVMGLQDDDPVTEGDAFWMTRPIAGGRLLAAKALVLVLFCFVPVLVCVPFWLSHNFGLALLGSSSAQVLWRQLLISLLAVPFAVVSSSGSKFVANTLIGAVALLGLALLYRLLEGSGLPGTLGPVPVVVPRGWLILAVWLTASVSIALNQYHRRRTRFSVAILVAAVVACFAIFTWRGHNGTLPKASTASQASSQQITEVAVREAAQIALDGRTIRILSVIPDFSRLIVVEVSESEPDATNGFPGSLGEAAGAASVQEHYLLVSRDDGRAVTADAARNPEELHAGRLRYFRTTLVFNPARDLPGEVPTNMAPWLEHAVLVKVEGRATGLVPPKGPPPTHQASKK
jgi:hypothetical protein